MENEATVETVVSLEVAMRSTITWALLVLALAVGVVLGAAGYRYWQERHLVYSDSTLVPSSVLSNVPALGRIEPADGIITINAPLPDCLQRYQVGIEEGARVYKGQPIAELASWVDRQLEYELVCLQISEGEQKKQNVQDLGQRKIQLEELRKQQLVLMEPLEKARQQSKLDYLERQAETYRKNRDRMYELPASTVSQQELEQQNLLMSQADAELTAAREAMQQLIKGHAFKRELAQAQIEAARAELARALLEIPDASLRQQKALAQRRVQQTRLFAPSDGEILKIYAHPGEMLTSQPILQIADTRRMVVTAEVYETDIGKVQVGQQAVVSSNVWPGQELAGRVTAKGRMIARNRVFDSDPTANVDRRVLEVTIQLENPEAAARLIHHQVHVKIFLTGATGAPR
jgi:HlyD family secretion protein